MLSWDRIKVRLCMAISLFNGLRGKGYLKLFLKIPNDLFSHARIL